MMNRSLTYEVCEGLQPLSEYEWELLFADHPDPPSLITLMSDCGLDGFELHSVIARVGGEPVVVLPIFLTHYSIASTLDGSIKRLGFKLEKLLPSVLKPKVMGVGFVEGEWGQIGINQRFPEGVIERALIGALDFIDSLADTFDAQVVAFKDFCDSSFSVLPAGIAQRFATAESLPYCQLPIDFSSVDDYLNALPRKVRQDLNRKLRQSAAVQVKYSTDIGRWIDQIYQLYSDQVDRSELSFGKHSKKYFSEICGTVYGAMYVLFFLDEKLIGFNLIIDRGHVLVDKYVGIDPIIGRAQNIYFLAFIEKIRYCTGRGIKLLHLGAAAEGVKVRLGAYTLPTYVMFQHRNPLMQWALKKMIGSLAYKPEALRLPDASLSKSSSSLHSYSSAQPEKTKCQVASAASQ